MGWARSKRCSNEMLNWPSGSRAPSIPCRDTGSQPGPALALLQPLAEGSFQRGGRGPHTSLTCRPGGSGQHLAQMGVTAAGVALAVLWGCVSLPSSTSCLLQGWLGLKGYGQGAPSAGGTVVREALTPHLPSPPHPTPPLPPLLSVELLSSRCGRWTSSLGIIRELASPSSS